MLLLFCKSQVIVWASDLLMDAQTLKNFNGSISVFAKCSKLTSLLISKGIVIFFYHLYSKARAEK